MFGTSSREKAYFGPFLTFLAFIALGELIGKLFDGQDAGWALRKPSYWIYPLQTLVCGGLLARWWRHYELRWPARPVFTVGIGILVLVLWVAPQQWFRAAPRLEGFEPAFFGGGAAYAVNLVFRFVRMTIVVPLLEEIFWRGFLLRYLIQPDFTRVPIGTFSWLSFALVTAGFCFEHAMPDWPAAVLAGMLYNAVAYRTRSLSACVLAHAVTNFLLGLYVLRTGQWGFW